MFNHFDGSDSSTRRCPDACIAVIFFLNIFVATQEYEILNKNRVVVAVIVGTLDLQLPVQSVHIITKVESSNLAHGKVYSIYFHVIKFASDLRQVGGFLRILWFPPPIKLTAIK